MLLKNSESCGSDIRAKYLISKAVIDANYETKTLENRMIVNYYWQKCSIVFLICLGLTFHNSLWYSLDIRKYIYHSFITIWVLHSRIKLTQLRRRWVRLYHLLLIAFHFSLLGRIRSDYKYFPNVKPPANLLVILNIW